MGRQKVVDQLKERIKLLNEENGYSYKPKAYEWLVTPLEKRDLPAIVIRDTEAFLEEYGDGAKRHTLSVEIELYTASDDAEPQRLREMSSELLRVLNVHNSDEPKPIGDYFSIGKIEMEIAQEDFKIGLVKIEAAVIYHTEEIEEWH